MAIPGIQEIQALATKYSKPQLQRMAQMGLIEPTKAVMAGMMIDRITKQNLQPPVQTVAEEVMSPPQAMPQAMPQQAAGMTALPSGLPTEMAGGGIVAFAEGGEVPGYAEGDLISASDTFRRGLATQPDEMMPPPPRPEAESSLPALPGGYRFREYAQTERPTLESQFDVLKRAEQMAGVDTPKLLEQFRQEEKARREELKGRRDQAKGEALMMAGFGLLGARRGKEFETLSTVGRQALMMYNSSLREIRDTERDISKAERELLLAEDRLKRDQSAKAADLFERKQAKYEDLQIRRDDQYNEGVKTLAKFIADKEKLDIETATRKAIAVYEGDIRLKVEKLQQSGAFARAGMGETSALAKEILPDLRKTNPNATLADAVAIVKGGAGSGAAALADKAYDNVMKRLDKDYKLAAEISKDPTALQRAVDEETKRLQAGGARPQATTGAPAYQLSPEAQKALQQYGGK